MHGLRKNAGILLAENGANVPQIMAVLGHKTPTMALYYVERANKAKLADQGAAILDQAVEAKAGGAGSRATRGDPAGEVRAIIGARKDAMRTAYVQMTGKD